MKGSRMFEYGPTAATAPVPRGGGGAPARDLAPRRWRSSISPGGAGRSCSLPRSVAALCGFALSKVLPPRYASTAQIYIDPNGQPGGDKQETAPGQDSNGFVNYVESQALIVTSRSVLEKVAEDQKLDRDSEFAPTPLLGALTGARRGPDNDPIALAARALADHVTVRRPERTFVIDVTVTDRDPARAAQLANATARAYIEVATSFQSDAARQAHASLTKRIDAMRQNVVDAERKVEDYKSEHGLVGARDQLVVEQQLKEITEQLSGARARMADAKAHVDALEASRRGGGDIGAIAAQLNLASLGPLRLAQSQARQQLAALAELGPLHPQRIEAEQRLAAANAAVDAELGRIAGSLRLDYSRARDLEASLSRQLADLKQQTVADGDSAVGLRDLERQAAAARDVYALFVNRSRDAGDINQVEPPRAKIISLAEAPKNRTFPPSGALLALLGLILGAAAGLGSAYALDSRRGAPTPEPESATPDAAPQAAPLPPSEPPPTPRVLPIRKADPTRRMEITGRSRLRRRSWAQYGDLIDLTGLGFLTLAADADRSEFEAILSALAPAPAGANGVPEIVAIAGPNPDELRTSLTVNLALVAAGRGLKVALIDADRRTAALSRAVQSAGARPPFEQDTVFDTIDGVRLAIPAEGSTGSSLAAFIKRLANSNVEALDLVLCDGPHSDESDASAALSLAGAVGIYDLGDEEAQNLPLAPGARRLRLRHRFAAAARQSA